MNAWIPVFNNKSMGIFAEDVVPKNTPNHTLLNSSHSSEVQLLNPKLSDILTQ